MSNICDLKCKRVLVTGASGFVGRHVLERGLALGVRLHALSRSEHHADGVEWWRGDLLDADAIKKILSAVRPHSIIHLAASGVEHGADRVRDVFSVNVEGLAVLLDAVKDAGINPHVVIAGSGFEYAPQDRPLREDDPLVPNSIYGVSKVAATHLARIYGTTIPITVLRLFSLYGPGEQEPRVVPYVVAQVKRGLPVELTPGEQVRAYTYVVDAAEGFWRALASPPSNLAYQVMNLASGNHTTLRAFLEALRLLLLERGLRPDLRFGARCYRSNELMNYTADIERLRMTLDWFPSTSLHAGLSLMLDPPGKPQPERTTHPYCGSA
jgi:nucleoside-diphosphate-sugar epimerase